MEEWNNVPDYNGLYSVSNFGNVASFAKGSRKILKPRLIHGYQCVDLYKKKE